MTLEFGESKKKIEAFYDFQKECRSFLENVLNSGQGFIWVAGM
ncbi:hypothetical protein PU629_09270 [Pullulanibacillus sp. KACC 23026]|nr:hypothetical protein [Pullulanibacillus sp. KACC 23026]WEG14526.1 hypothetical protein PU629_09270 [Pullulanibacillus sp. KACC 23026]